MKAKKIAALLLASSMALSLVACGGKQATQTDSTSATEAEETADAAAGDAAKEEAVEEASAEVSIDFEDGAFGFVGNDKTVNSAAGDSTFSVEDYNGGKALKITSSGKAIYAGIQADALLGDKASDLKTVEMTVGTENPDGTFYSSAGNIYGFTGEKNNKSNAAWSVYLETANPKTISYTVPDGETFGAGNYLVLSLENDTGKDKGATPANLYVADITFKDASGNVLAADTSAEYVAADTGSDRSNLCALTDVVEFEGFAVSGDGWSQAGFTMPQEILDALVPGSVVEITYSSENGDMWVVMNEAAAGWMRVGQGNADGSGSDSAYINNSKTTAQITFEQIAALCSDDVSTWGTTMQCEASGAWEVYGVRVGTASEFRMINNLVQVPDSAVSGDGWSQAGFTMPQEMIDALVPGSVVTISYTSENGELWVVMNEAAVGWSRVGQGNYDGSGSDSAVCDGKTCQVTYEQIAAICGDDVSTWGTTMQCEASGAWEVYSVAVGQSAE